jgi:chemotaxis protein MotB
MTYRWHHEKLKEPRHTDDWLITYADVITLLLCFFVVFALMSAAKKSKPHEPIKSQTGVEATSAQNYTPLKMLPDEHAFHKLGPEDFPSAGAGSDMPEAVNPTAKMAALPVPAEPPAQPLPAPVDVQQKGDRITTIEINSAAFFDKGSAVLSAPGKVILVGVAGNLKSDQYRDYRITVEGHTDDTPISTPQFPSNWELSTARAAAVARSLIEMGIPAQKLRAAGYADTYPKVPNRDASGNPIPENQAKNRRVVIELEKIEKAQ